MTHSTTVELRSLVTAAGELQLSLVSVPLDAPRADEVIVRVEAAPLNPSDLALLFGGADLATAVAGGTPERPTITASIPKAALRGLGGRLDHSMAVGNEGAGTVVAAGDSVSAQALLGHTVAALGGGMYATFRRLKLAQVRVLPPGRTAVEGASAFVNPLTALAFLETMRREGHTAIVHTAAASNLGQMLQRLCIADGVPLVNIVRRADQAATLRALGATYVVDSSTPTFMADLVEAIVATKATLAFDAIGGGPLASQILTAMEAAVNRTATAYSRYGSSTMKQVYIYGALDHAPTTLTRSFGLTWSVGGWLVMPALAKAGPTRTAELEARVMADLTTTFASKYTKHVSLAGALDLATLRAYAKAATGEKYLIAPH